MIEQEIDDNQDLKDFARSTGQLDVVYSETGRNDGKGYTRHAILRGAQLTRLALLNSRLAQT